MNTAMLTAPLPSPSSGARAINEATSLAVSATLTSPTLHVQLEQGNIAYRRIGMGSPLLMINRFRGTLDTWDPAFIDALARHHTVYLFDLPGIGYSTGAQPDTMEIGVRMLGGLADALQIEQFDLLGWSWGGLLAQAYVLDRPGRANRLVLLATNPAGKNGIPLQQAFLERALKPVNDLADEEVLFFEPASEASRSQACASRERIRQRTGVDEKIPATSEQYQRYFHAAEEFHTDDAGRRERLIQTDQPILVICGDHDTSTAGQNWFPLIGQMRNATFVYYSSTGHAPHHQYPEQVARQILEFLAHHQSQVPGTSNPHDGQNNATPGPIDRCHGGGKGSGARST